MMPVSTSVMLALEQGEGIKLSPLPRWAAAVHLNWLMKLHFMHSWKLIDLWLLLRGLAEAAC